MVGLSPWITGVLWITGVIWKKIYWLALKKRGLVGARSVNNVILVKQLPLSYADSSMGLAALTVLIGSFLLLKDTEKNRKKDAQII